MNTTKEKIEELLKRLTNVTDDVLDDGYDSQDCEQNRNFTNQVKNVESAGKELAGIEIDGVDGDTLNKLWHDAWAGAHNVHLPENKLDHHIRYAQQLLDLIESMED